MGLSGRVAREVCDLGFVGSEIGICPGLENTIETRRDDRNRETSRIQEWVAMMMWVIKIYKNLINIWSIFYFLLWNYLIIKYPY